jgi:hypothetical protein
VPSLNRLWLWSTACSSATGPVVEAFEGAPVASEMPTVVSAELMGAEGVAIPVGLPSSMWLGRESPVVVWLLAG